MKTAYQQMLNESRRIGWPVSYKEDLTKHDREFIRTRKPSSFIWLLRECGTFLYAGYPGLQDDSEHLAYVIKSDEQSKLEDQHRYYKFEHGKLTQIKRSRAQYYLTEYCRDCDSRCVRLGLDTTYLGKHGWKHCHVKHVSMTWPSNIYVDQRKSKYTCFACKHEFRNVYNLVMTRTFSIFHMFRKDFESGNIESLDKFMATEPGHVRCKKCMREWIRKLGIVLATSDLETKKQKDEGTS